MMGVKTIVRKVGMCKIIWSFNLFPFKCIFLIYYICVMDNVLSLMVLDILLYT